MNDNTFSVKINERHVILEAWSNNNGNDTSLHSKEHIQQVSMETKEEFKSKNLKKKMDLLTKRAEIFKTFVLVVITLVSFGMLIHQGSICISK